MLKVFIMEDNAQQLTQLQKTTEQVLAELHLTGALVFTFNSTVSLSRELP